MSVRFHRKTSKVRDEIAELLQRYLPHLEVSADDVVPVTGFWLRVDVYRFQVFCHEHRRYTNGDRIPVSLGCWDPMRKFVRECKKAGGCHIDDGELWYGSGKETRLPSLADFEDHR